MMHPIQIGSLVILFIAFLAVPAIVKALDTSLDTLPMRFAAVILVLALLPYDRFIALALFLVVAAIYIQHHHNDLIMVIGSGEPLPLNETDAMSGLPHGGHADETSDDMDYMPKESTNVFSKVESIDEKQVLESVGNKSVF